MAVISVAIALLAIGGAGYGLLRFDRYVCGRFGYRFFTKLAFALSAAAAGSIYGGCSWQASARLHGGDPLNGIALVVIGAAIAIGIIAWNFRRTNIAVGAAGTGLQIVTFSVLAYVGASALVLYLFVGIILSALGGAKPVYVVNK